MLMVWADVETTGLDDDDALLEIAVRITTPDLETVGDPLSIVLHAHPAWTLKWDQMSDVVRDMHTSSGLLKEVQESRIGTKECQDMIMSYVTQHIPEPGIVPLCGSSIHFDRRFIARDLPAFNRHLSYRNVDVSTIKELVKRWHPEVLADYERGAIRIHRAAPDVLASIAELRYYRREIFRADNLATGRSGAAR